MRHRSRLRDAIEYGLAVAALSSLAYTPLAVSNLLARWYARLLDLALPRLRRVAMANLAMALPDMGLREHARIADGVYLSIARLLVSFARFPQIDRDNVGQWIRYEGFEHFEQARRRGKGVLFATAHLGNWELSAFAHALLSAPMYVVVRPLDNPLIDRLVARRRTMSGNRLIEKKDFARGILQALAANEAVGILIDQNASLETGVFVDFFGIPACTASGLARIALRTDAAVVPGFTIWDESLRKYRLRFDPALELVRTGDLEADIVSNTQKFTKVIEDYVRKYPEQWLWVHRRWKTRPPGQEPLY